MSRFDAISSEVIELLNSKNEPEERSSFGSSLRRKWAERRGLRESKRPCIQRLIGNRCDYTDCRPSGYGLDHTVLFNLNGKPAVLVSEPYQLEDDDFMTLAGFCKQHNLTVLMTTKPWHDPACLHIEIWRPEAYREYLEAAWKKAGISTASVEGESEEVF